LDAPNTVSPPFVSSRIVVFSDFNCPYCFTLNEWINDLGVGHRVRWVGIEHKPELPRMGDNAPEDRMLLRQEIDDVDRRAPEVGVVTPTLWANSHDALLIQNAIEDDNPELAPQVRRTIFQRYWQGGSALDETSLQPVLEGLALDKPEVEPDYLESMTQWWRTHLDRIPAMVAPTGITHLGLQNKQQVRAFLNSALRATDIGPGCQ